MTSTILSDRTKKILDEAKYGNVCLADISAVDRRNATVWYHTLDGTIYGVGSSVPRDKNGERLEDMACITVMVDKYGLTTHIIKRPEIESIDNPMSKYCEKRVTLQILAWRMKKVRE